MIKKIINALLNQSYTLLGMFLAWIVFEGSAKMVAGYAIAFTIIADVLYQVFVKEDDGN